MAFTSNNISLKNKVTKNNEPEKQLSFLVELVNYTYKDEESGFYVGRVKIPDNFPNLNETINGKQIIGKVFSIVGTSTYVVENIKEKQEITVYGAFEESKGRIQFKVENVIEVIPTKPKAIQLFLSSGKIVGIGPVIAKKIVDKYGSETIKMLDERPDELLSISGVTEKKLVNIKESWKKFRDVYEIITVMKFYGIGDSNGVKIYNHFKEKSLSIIKTEPYKLTEVPMIGFKTADKIAQSIGISNIDPQRVKYGILYTLEKLSEEGNTAYPYNDLIVKVNEQLGIEEELIKQELELLIKNDEVVSKTLKIKKNDLINKSKIVEDYFLCIAHKKYHNIEVRIANEISRIVNTKIKKDDVAINNFIDKNEFKLDESQLEATRSILSNKFSILTGGPGTGKTHTIKSILNFYKKSGKRCLLCAPTGRAAKRMEESTGMAASTMHRVLGYKDGKFIKNENLKIEEDIIFMDEQSMTDTILMNGFLKAVKDTATIIMVGDVDQLPSVGPGNILKDLIDCSYINVARLNVVHRQALNSNIVKASHKIIKNEMPDLSNKEGSDFIFIEQEDTGNIIDDNHSIYNEILKTVDNIVLTQEYNKDDVQILTPRKDTLCGVDELNRGLKQLLNFSQEYEDNTSIKFTNNDRVMQYKNNYDLDIFNGDVGKVVNVNLEEQYALINFDNKLIELEGNDMKDIKLSYAITVHKSQGSDYPCVIIPLSKSHSFMWDCNLLYTAITRGKGKVYIIGDKRTLSIAISKFKQVFRITGLKQEIQNFFNEELNVDIEKKKNKI